MEKDVFEHYSWASNQEAIFWYDGPDGETIRLATDQELLSLLRSSKVVKFIMTVGRSDHLVVASEVNELQIEPRIGDSELQIVVRNEFPIENGGAEWAEEPEHGLTAAGPNRAEEEETEHYMDPGFDAEGDDPTGADEEWRYFKKQPKTTDAGAERDNSDKVEPPKEKRKVGD